MGGPHAPKFSDRTAAAKSCDGEGALYTRNRRELKRGPVRGSVNPSLTLPSNPIFTLCGVEMSRNGPVFASEPALDVMMKGET